MSQGLVDVLIPGYRGKADRRLPILVFPTTVSLIPEARRLGFKFPRNSPKIDGVFLCGGPKCFTRGGKPLDCIGLILLAKSKLGAGYVAHEISHAVLELFYREGWMKKLAANPLRFFAASRELKRSCDENERFCDCMEHYTRAFWTAWYKVPKKLRGNK